MWVGGFCGLILQERVTDLYHSRRALANTSQDAVSHKCWISGEFNRAQDLSKDIVNHPLYRVTSLFCSVPFSLSGKT